MARRTAPGLLLLLLAALPAHALEAAPRGLLWEVRGGGGHAWLLGSVHAGQRDLYPLPAPVEEAFRGSAVLVVEADVSERRSAQTRAQALAAATLPAGRHLKDVVSERTWKLTQEGARRMGLDLAALEGYEPWFVALSLEMVAVMREGVDPERGIDRHFLEQAGDRPIVELEGAPFQFALFHGLDAKTQDLFLRYTLEEIDEVPRELPRLFDAWRRGDEKALAADLFEPLEKHAELRGLREILFTSRNRKMAARVAELLEQKKNLFVVVGAGHLLGPDGVPALLQARGLDAQRR